MDSLHRGRTIQVIYQSGNRSTHSKNPCDPMRLPVGPTQHFGDRIAFMVEVGTALGVIKQIWYPAYAWWLHRWGTPLRVAETGGNRSSWSLSTPDVLTPAQLATVPSAAPFEIYEWLVTEQRAFTQGSFKRALVLESRSRSLIHVFSIEAVIEGRSTQQLGAMVASPPAGAFTVTYLGFDLCSGATLEPFEMRRGLDGDEWTDTPYFQSNRINVAPDESFPFNVIAHTGADTVTWRLRIRYRISGRERQCEYPPQKTDPFKFTGQSARTASEQRFLCGVAGLDGPPYLREITLDDNFAG